MPYLPSQARFKSETYQKILDADIIEQQELLLNLKAKQNVSGSIDGTSALRDASGTLIYIESPFKDGQTIQGSGELVRLENRQQFFDDTKLDRINREFTHFLPPVGAPTTPKEEEEEIEKEQAIVQEKKQNPALPMKQMFVRFVNLAMKANYPLTLNTDKLNALITQVIKENTPTEAPIVWKGPELSQSKFFIMTNNFRPDLIKPFKLDFKFGSLTTLIKLSLFMKNSDYPSIFKEFVLPNKKLQKIWILANEDTPEEEFETLIGTQTEEELRPVVKRTTIPIEADPYNNDEEELRGKGLIA